MSWPFLSGTPVLGRAGEGRVGSASDRLQRPPNPHTRALRATQVPPRSGDRPGRHDRGAAAAGSAPPAPARASGRRYASEGAGRSGAGRGPDSPRGRRRSGARPPCATALSTPGERSGAGRRPQPARRASVGPSLPARRHSPLPLAQTTPLRPSRAPPLPRAAIFAARRPRHLLGPPYLPGRRRWRRPSHT